MARFAGIICSSCKTAVPVVRQPQNHPHKNLVGLDSTIMCPYCDAKAHYNAADYVTIEREEYA